MEEEGLQQATYDKEKKRQEKRAERLEGKEKRRAWDDLEQRILGEWGSPTNQREERKRWEHPGACSRLRRNQTEREA